MATIQSNQESCKGRPGGTLLQPHVHGLGSVVGKAVDDLVFARLQARDSVPVYTPDFWVQNKVPHELADSVDPASNEGEGTTAVEHQLARAVDHLAQSNRDLTSAYLLRGNRDQHQVRSSVSHGIDYDGGGHGHEDRDDVPSSINHGGDDHGSGDRHDDDNGGGSQDSIVSIVKSPEPIIGTSQNPAARTTNQGYEVLGGVYVPHDASVLTMKDQEGTRPELLQIGKEIGELRARKRQLQDKIGSIDRRINQATKEGDVIVNRMRAEYENGPANTGDGEGAQSRASKRPRIYDASQ